jgi:PAS domain-containing protein
VKAGEAYYHQTVVNIPESRRIRLYNIDITARKQAEDALLAAMLQKQAAEYARSLIEVSIDPLVTISPEGKITDVNEATVKATGVQRAELVGTDFSSYFTEPEKAEQGIQAGFHEAMPPTIP